MATRSRSPEQVRDDIASERERLRGEIGQAANIGDKLKAKLPVVAGGAATVGFVLAGGVGATMRYFARRSREGHEKARVGRWSLRNRG